MSTNTRLFETKATTLEWFRGKLQNSKICPSLIYKVSDWNDDSEKVIQEIMKNFKEGNLIVRSSSSLEDGSNSSLAGMFESIMHVDSTSITSIRSAIEEVIESYRKVKLQDHDLFFVQPMVENVSMSGVAFTRDINTGGPYYIVNYDDISGSTETITSGVGGENRTIYIHRNGSDKLFSSRFQKLIKSISEIESLVEGDIPLDIEFAQTKDEETYLLQVRPMSAKNNWERNLDQEVNETISNVHNFILTKLKKSGDVRILGDMSIYSDMSDWNPAEMIGNAPRALASSLYREIITDTIWAEARTEMGYRDLTNIPLMVTLGGRPYIDVRNSFNTYLPAKLDESIGEKLVNFWLKNLKESPWLHDKVEFEIATTCYTFDFDDLIGSRYKESGLTQDEFSTWKKSLIDLTEDIIANKTISKQIQNINELEKRRDSRANAMASNTSDEIIALIQGLLVDCKLYGTKPFSIFARCAFMAEEFLRSFIRLGILTNERVEELKKSTKTVLTELLELIPTLNENSEEFFKKFGHLRPGTYDILSPRYDAFQKDRLKSNKKSDSTLHTETDFALSESESSSINKILSEVGFSFDSDVLITFIRDAITTRELGKLKFTKNLSDTLENVARLGEKNDFSREEMSFVSIHNILKFSWNVGQKDLQSELKRLITSESKNYEVTKSLRFPSVLSQIEDVHIAPLVKAQPNFVTHKRVEGEIVYLDNKSKDVPPLANKLVLIEGADPGYDWIFVHEIDGLITRYGGTNSHMAIRCAELGIPAVIGCGGQLFESLVDANQVAIDCEARTIKVIS